MWKNLLPLAALVLATAGQAQPVTTPPPGEYYCSSLGVNFDGTLGYVTRPALTILAGNRYSVFAKPGKMALTGDGIRLSGGPYDGATGKLSRDKKGRVEIKLALPTSDGKTTPNYCTQKT